MTSPQVMRSVWRRLPKPSKATMDKLNAMGKGGEAVHYGWKVTVGEIVDAELAQGRPTPTFFRELINVATTKCLGTEELPRDYCIDNRERIVGAWGVRDVLLLSPLELQRGHRVVLVKASEQKPIKCKEHIYAHL